jgi:hypothetical protein
MALGSSPISFWSGSSPSCFSASVRPPSQPAAPRRPAELWLRQAFLWNLGVVAVPVGVLAQTRLAVIAGSLSLIVALASLTRNAGPGLAESIAHRRWRGWGYAALLAAMAVSTLIGTALAWDIPWT